MTDWISKSAEMRFKLPFEEAIAARLSMEDAEWAFYEPFSIAVGGVVGDRPRIVVEFPMLYSGLPEPALPGVTRPKSLACGRVSIAVSGAGCRPVCGRRPRRRSMKAAPCPDWVQTIDCHPCPSFGGGPARRRYSPLPHPRGIIRPGSHLSGFCANTQDAICLYWSRISICANLSP